MCGVYHIYSAIKQTKNLDLSYKTDLELWDCFEGKDPYYNRISVNHFEYGA